MYHETHLYRISSFSLIYLKSVAHGSFALKGYSGSQMCLDLSAECTGNSIIFGNNVVLGHFAVVCVFLLLLEEALMMLLSGTLGLISLTDEADAGCLKSSLPISPAVVLCGFVCEEKREKSR